MCDFMQVDSTVRSVVSYFVHAFEQTQKKPLSLDKGFSKLGPGSLEGQPVLPLTWGWTHTA
jgi:hypothetical protein